MTFTQTASKTAATALELLLAAFLLSLFVMHWVDPRDISAMADPPPASAAGGLLPVQGTAQPVTFDCLQNEKGDLVLKIDSKTGDYTFISCQDGHLEVTGKGKVESGSCKLSFQDSGPDMDKPDRRVSANVNTCTKTADVRVELFEPKLRFSFSDKNVTDNKCKCP